MTSNPLLGSLIQPCTDEQHQENFISTIDTDSSKKYDNPKKSDDPITREERREKKRNEKKVYFQLKKKQKKEAKKEQKKQQLLQQSQKTDSSSSEKEIESMDEKAEKDLTIQNELPSSAHFWKERKTKLNIKLSKILYGDFLTEIFSNQTNSDSKGEITTFAVPKYLNLLEKTPKFLNELLKENICVCFDCGFDNLMKLNEIQSAMQQILIAYSDNCKAKVPFFFSVTGLKGMRHFNNHNSKKSEIYESLSQRIGPEKMKDYFEINEQESNQDTVNDEENEKTSLFETLYGRAGSESWFVDFSKKEFHEHFKDQFENGNIVYLTADVPGLHFSWKLHFFSIVLIFP